MSVAESPARQLLLLLEDEASLADLPIDEVAEELALLGADPADSIARARKWAGKPPAPRPAPTPIVDVEKPEEPLALAPIATAAPAIPTPVEFAPADALDTGGMGYSTAAPGPDLMADIGIRANNSSEPAKKKVGGAGVVVAILLLALVAGGSVAAVKIWPELVDLDRLTAIADGLVAQPAAPPPTETSAEPAPEVSVARLEPVPPPVPPPTPVESRPAAPEPAPAPVVVEAAPTPPPQSAPVVVEAAPTPAGQPTASGSAAAPATDSGAPLNIVPRVEAPPVQEARLPADVARPFTAPPSIVAIVPVDRELVAAAGTGMLSSGSRRSAEETRLASRLEDAQRIAAGRVIAALVAMRTAEENFDAVILQRPRAEEDRTIADADQSLIPIMGDTAHLFDLVRLAPQ